MGNNVTCVDIDKTKIANLKNGILPIYEPGLETMVLDNQKKDTLSFTTKIGPGLKKANICFIAVGTPMGQDGSADLQYVLEVAKDIGKYMSDQLIIVDKSTVPVGTADKVRESVQNELNKRSLNISFDIVSNPEFLKEGAAIEDFMHPDRVVIGSDNQQAVETMSELYNPFMTKNNRLILMDIRSAEMTKYTANAMLATKISFMNEIANICERVGADVNHVRNGIGSDSRIGYSFIYPGCGYGGSCFPKDIQALIKTSKDYGYFPRILDSVEAVNYDQKKVIVNKVITKFGEDLHELSFAVWGLSFKPETDDMRDSTSIKVIKELTSRGARIKAYDPKAMGEAKAFYLKGNSLVAYKESKYSALNNCDALILLTEWKEFRSPDFNEIKKLLKKAVLFDGRNQYNKDKMKDIGFEYIQIGVV
jgi:UDPglucose 6-dehydrogenase